MDSEISECSDGDHAHRTQTCQGRALPSSGNQGRHKDGGPGTPNKLVFLACIEKITKSEKDKGILMTEHNDLEQYERDCLARESEQLRQEDIEARSYHWRDDHLAQFNRFAKEKFRKGQKEHGGFLPERVDMDHILEEVIDLVFYVLAMREKLYEQTRQPGEDPPQPSFMERDNT